MLGGAEGLSMGNGEPSGSAGGKDRPVILASAVRASAGVGVRLLVAALADLRGFLPGGIAVCVGSGIGVLLGRFAGSFLFRPSPGGGTPGNP